MCRLSEFYTKSMYHDGEVGLVLPHGWEFSQEAFGAWQERNVLADAQMISEWIAGEKMLPKSPEKVTAKLKAGEALVLHHSFNAGTRGAKTVFTPMAYYEVDVWPGTEWVELSGLVVNPEYRRQGWGEQAKLLGTVKARWMHPGKRLFVLATNPKSQALNRKLGAMELDPEELPIEVWGPCKMCPANQGLIGPSHCCAVAFEVTDLKTD